MSIPNEALQKLVQEIETRAASAQRDFTLVKSHIAAKQREIRLVQLTASEVTQLPRDAKVYEGVGKMFVLRPTSQVEKRLSAEVAELKSEINSLEKKLHYLETTHKNSREHIDQILRSGSKV